jgi:hypothetical protein
MSDSNSNYLKTPPDWRFNAAANLYTNEAGETRPNIYGNPRFDIGAAPVVDPEVVRPAHYTRGAVECVDAIEAALTPEEYRGYLKGNVLKYFWRERDKGGLQSIQKAEYYTQRLIKLLGEK